MCFCLAVFLYAVFVDISRVAVDRGSFNALINLQFSLDFAMTSLPRIRWLWKMAAKSCEPWRGHFGWEKRSWTFSDLAVRMLLFSWQTKALIKDDVCTLRGAILTFKPRNRQVFHGDAVRKSLKVKYTEIVLAGTSLRFVLGREIRQRKWKI